jgi:hydroxyacylglutathione hydrolase
MHEVVTIATPGLGDRSYLAHDGETGIVVDAQRDIDRFLAAADQAGVRISHVLETHIHNDYLTGGLALCRATGAAYHVAAGDEVVFDRTPVADGDEIQVGRAMRLRVVATPGHTHTHLAYVLSAPGRPPAAFTGGSLLFGATGRPDLLGAQHTHGLAHAQYASAHRLAELLPDDAELYPTHGFGSFCTVGESSTSGSTVGAERAANPVFTAAEDEYVAALLAGLDAYPAYYAHMGPANQAGPAAAELSAPAVAGAAELRRRIDAGEWVVDLRTRTAFAAGHVVGSLNFGLDGSFATYLGWLIPWGTPLTLLGATAADVDGARRELLRIGLEGIAASATGPMTAWTGGAAPGAFPTADMAGLSAVVRHRPVVVLDVRRVKEWEDAHIQDAVHIPLHELLGRLDDVPPGEVWVHCASGYRASIAASVLDAAGRAVVAVDDDFGSARLAGLPMEAAG